MGIVKWEGIEAEARRLKERQRREAARFVSQRRFVEDHLPGLVADMTECGLYYRAVQSKDRPGIFNVTLERCHILPWCIACAQAAEWKRAKALERAFKRCTPEGQEPRFVQIVQAARLTEDGDGWGLAASRDVRRFKRVVWSVVGEHYEGDLGASMTYQDFGEEGFAKRNPHLDFTLNGWCLMDGEPAQVPRIDLTPARLAKWHTDKGRFARRAFGHAWTKRDEAPGRSLNISRVAVGVGAYFKAMEYQVREMVDMRKLEYDRERQVVYWHNYRDSTRQKLSVLDFKAGVEEYRMRLGQWPDEGEIGQELTTRHGHMSHRKVKATQEAMGGVDPWDSLEQWETGYLPA